MTPTDELIQRADAWVDAYWNADHLRRTADWLHVIAPDAAPALVLAALTHDMERAVPGPDAPMQDARRGADDPEYNRLHQARSARIVGEWLREQGAGADLVVAVSRLVGAHEDGGWPAADLLQAADSLSFLETNVDLFLSFVRAGKHHYGPAEVREKFAYMYERIRVPEARERARPLYLAALARLEAFEAERAGAEQPAKESRS